MNLSIIPYKVRIPTWIKNYAVANNMKSLVIGISGGVDSSVVSTLCAETGLPVHAVSMPIRQIKEQNDLSQDHGQWLAMKYENVTHHTILLDSLFNSFVQSMPGSCQSEHAYANSKSRLRMVTLYQIASSHKGLVVGTGNKVEDFGVGFYTKYGDGGVDISPIGDLLKTEVWDLAKDLNILQTIIDAPPTDGLWEDGRTDKDQLGGLTYEDMERAMDLDEKGAIAIGSDQDLLKKYHEVRKLNLHKMSPIPIYNKNNN